MIRFCKVTRGCATMDTEIEKKLTEQQHQIEMLREKVQGSMKTMKAENESAIDRLQLSNEKAIGGLRTDFEKLRTTIEGNSKILIFQTIGVVVAVVGIAGLLVKVFDS